MDDTLWMLKPLLDERGVALRVDSAPGPRAVFVDATLTRQALFQVLRALLRHRSGGRDVAPAPVRSRRQTHLVLRAQTCERRRGNEQTGRRRS